MDPKSKSRRELLKGGAAAVGTVAAGASVSKIAFAANPGIGAALPTYAANEAPMVPASEDVIAYGVRSHYVTSKRIPALGRAVTRRLWVDVPHRHAVAGFYWHDPGIVAPLCGDDQGLLHPGHRSREAHSDD